MSKQVRWVPASVLVLLCLSLSQSALAIGEWYIGGGVGISNVSDTVSGSQADLAVRIDDDDFGYKIFAGYQVLEILSIEGGYRDFGSFSEFDGINIARTQTDGFDVFGVFNLPLGPVDLFAKAGVIYWSTDYSFDAVQQSDSGTDFAAGIGLGFSLFELGARVEYEIFDADRPEDLDMFSFSVSYGF